MANYLSIVTCDIANGPGVRVSVFFSGCRRNCPGCFNPETHDPENGRKFDQAAKDKIFSALSRPFCSGISLLGGDPLSKCSDNRKTTIALCKEIREKFPDKSIMLWTGYTVEELRADKSVCEILDWVDVIVDGPFDIMKKSVTLKYRGSANQRVVNISGREIIS